MQVKTFTVLPGGRTFDTSVLLGKDDPGGPAGDMSNAYYRAHRHVATQAALTGKPHQVFKNDRGNEPMGFGGRPNGTVDVIGALQCEIMRQIRELCLSSYFDFSMKAWCRLSEEKASQERKLERQL